MKIRMTLVLASGSPRRRELLAATGVGAFDLCVFAIDESPIASDVDDAEGARADLRYLERITTAKRIAAQTGLRLQRGIAGLSGASPCWVLVADTVVSLEGEILGKPVDTEEATAFLMRLSGTTHEVSTRFSLSQVSGRVPHPEEVFEQTVHTRVTFRTLELREAKAYAQTGEGLDKAGGYAIQGGASAFVLEIHGSYTNVVGLPVAQVAMVLRRCGLMA
jgi:septum formation protein